MPRGVHPLLCRHSVDQVDGSNMTRPLGNYSVKLATAALHAALMALAALLLLAGCEPHEQWTLGSPTSYPAAVDYWPQGKIFLAGSYHDGSIVRLPRNAKAAKDPNQDQELDGRRKTLRLKVDPVRNWLWVLDVDSVFVYALPDQKLLHRIKLPKAVPSKEACLPDIAIDPEDGTVYISDLRHPTIYMLKTETDQGPPLRLDISVQFEGGTEYHGGFSALVVYKRSRALIAGSASSGGLWWIDPATGNATAIAAPRFEGICGMSVLAPQVAPHLHRLPQRPLIYATTGFRNQVLSISLTPDLRRATATGLAPPIRVQVPISVIAFPSIVVVASSQLDRHTDFGGDSDPALPFRLVLMPIRPGPASLMLEDIGMIR